MVAVLGGYINERQVVWMVLLESYPGFHLKSNIKTESIGKLKLNRKVQVVFKLAACSALRYVWFVITG